jgi:hypothetical protein
MAEPAAFVPGTHDAELRELRTAYLEGAAAGTQERSAERRRWYAEAHQP